MYPVPLGIDKDEWYRLFHSTCDRMLRSNPEMTRGEIRCTGKVYEASLDLAVLRGIITPEQADEQRFDNMSAMSPAFPDDYKMEEPPQSIDDRIAELRVTAELWAKRAKEAYQEAEEAAKNASDILVIIAQLEREKEEEAVVEQLTAVDAA
jgi:hypothetical protein